MQLSLALLGAGHDQDPGWTPQERAVVPWGSQGRPMALGLLSARRFHPGEEGGSSKVTVVRQVTQGQEWLPGGPEARLDCGWEEQRAPEGSELEAGAGAALPGSCGGGWE